MRYAKDHADETRQRIVTRASARFRADGVAGVGVRTLIGDAGLTHGAFYAHFDSKADLLALSVTEAFAQTLAFWRAHVMAAAPGDRFAAFVDGYLSDRHRRAVETGCAGAALAPELGRQDDAVRRAFMRGVDDLAAFVAELLPSGGDADARRARTLFAAMMGSLQLSRIASDADADAILADARDAALAMGQEA